MITLSPVLRTRGPLPCSAAPEPDHLEVWDYWRRVMVHGGVVLSSNIESDTHARGYYRADGEPLHFANCYPRIHRC